MAKPISGQGIVQDLRAGFTDSQLQEKYSVRPDALPYLMRRLVDAGLMTDLEMYQRKSLSESDLMRAFKGSDEAVLRCSVCGSRLSEENVLCPQCENLDQEFTETLILDRDDLLSNLAPIPMPSNPGATTVRKDDSNISALRDKETSAERQYLPTDPFVEAPNLLDHVDVVTNTLKEVKNGEDYRKKALLKAASQGLVEKVKELLDLGVDVNGRSKYGSTSLMEAAFKGHADVTKLLLERKADVNARNAQGNTALIFAIGAGHAATAEFLLGHGADACCKTTDGNNALMFACSSDNPDLVRLLLRSGADVDERNTAGDTPLMKACTMGRVQMAEDLIVAGASINVGDNHGNTALMRAAFKGYYSVVRLLLAARADVNVKNARGKTALMKACARGHFRVAKLLLEGGADVNAMDKDGLTALMRAERNRRQDLIDLFLKYLFRDLADSDER